MKALKAIFSLIPCLDNFFKWILLIFIELTIILCLFSNIYGITIDGDFEDWIEINPIGIDEIGDGDIVDWTHL